MRVSHLAFACLFILVVIVASASAADLTFYGDGVNSGGIGPWDTTTANIWSDGTTPQAWSNTGPNNAIFAGAAAVNTVTLGGPITVGNMTFSSTGTPAVAYTIAGVAANPLSFGTAGTITTNSDATISAIIAGTNGFTKNGTGALTISGTNTLTAGSIILSAGTLNLTNANASFGPDSPTNTVSLTITGGALGAPGGDIRLKNSGPTYINGDFSYTGATATRLFKFGGGTTPGAVIFDASHTINVIQGTLSLGAGTLTVPSGSQIIKTGAGTLATSLALTSAYNNTFNVQGGALAFNGTNTTFDGTNLFNTMPAGTGLQLNNSAALGAAPVGPLSINTNFTVDNQGGGVSLIPGNLPLTLASDFTYGTGGGTLSVSFGTGAITLTGTRTITANGGTAGHISNETLSLDGVIGDGGNHYGIIKNGPGVVSLTNANTFSGPVTLNAGILCLNNAGALGTSPSLTINGGTLANDFVSSSTITLSNNPALYLNGDFTYVSNDTASCNLNLGTGAVTLGGDRLITTGNSTGGSQGTLTIGGPITGAYAITSAGKGTLVLGGNVSTTSVNGITVASGSMNLNGTNTFTGNINIGSATLAPTVSPAIGFASAAAVPSTATLVFNGTSTTLIPTLWNTTITLPNAQTWSANVLGYTGTNATITLNGNVTMTQDVKVEPAVTGSNCLVVLGGNIDGGGHNLNITFPTAASASKMTLNGAMSNVGTLTVKTFTSGTSSRGLMIGNPAALACNTLVLDATGVQMASSSATNGVLTGIGAITLNGNLTIGSTLDPSSSVDLGTGNVTLGAAAPTLTVNTAGSTLTVGGNIQTTTNGLKIVGPGSVALNGNNAFSGPLSLGTTVILGNANALGTASSMALTANSTINVDGTKVSNVTYGNVISGTGFGLTKAGTGTLTLNGVNTYSGTTTVTAGTLAVGATGKIAGQTIVNAGATLAGPGTLTGINNSGTVAPKGAMLSNGDVALNAGGTFQVNLSGNTSADSLAVTGVTTLGGALNISTTYTPNNSDTWTILTSTAGITGSFSDITSGYVATVNGNSLVLSLIPVVPAYKQGDADKNNKIDGADLALVGLNWDPSGSHANTWDMGDFDGNGKIDGADLAFIGLNWAPAGYTMSSDAAPTVPEPVTMTLLAIGALGMLARRNRR